VQTIIILIVFSIHGTWETYDPFMDSEMKEWVDLDGCGKEADALMLRDGTVKSWVCVYQGDPRKYIFPPYDWPKLLMPEEEYDCDIKCLMEESDARRRTYGA